MKNIIIVIALFALPLVTMGAQQMLTEKSLRAEYKVQVQTIDSQITLLEKAPKKFTNYKGEYSQDYYDYLKAQEEVARLKEEKRILDIAYKLVVNSFQ